MKDTKKRYQQAPHVKHTVRCFSLSVSGSPCIFVHELVHVWVHKYWDFFACMFISTTISISMSLSLHFSSSPLLFSSFLSPFLFRVSSLSFPSALVSSPLVPFLRMVGHNRSSHSAREKVRKATSSFTPLSLRLWADTSGQRSGLERLVFRIKRVIPIKEMTENPGVKNGVKNIGERVVYAFTSERNKYMFVEMYMYVEWCVWSVWSVCVLFCYCFQ